MIYFPIPRQQWYIFWQKNDMFLSLSWIHTFIALRWAAVAFTFRLQLHCLAINTHAERFQMTKRILCHERETLLKLELQLMQWYRSWGSVLILIYRLDAHDLNERKCACDKAIKMNKIKNDCVRVWIQLYSLNLFIKACHRNLNKRNS